MRFREDVAVRMVGLFLWLGSPALAGNLVVNGNFEGPFGDPNYHCKERFTDIKPYGWFGGDKLTYLSAPNFATVVDNNGGLAVWKQPAATSPDGGRFVMADGDPTYSDTFYQVINGLTVGQTYVISFYQAAGQNRDKTGATWEQWKVGLGDQYQYSDLMETPSQGTHPWERQTLYFVAESVSANLSFLAYGGPGGGPMGGLPPVSFLDGVSMRPASVPEPGALLTTALGISGMYGIRFWRRRTVT